MDGRMKIHLTTFNVLGFDIPDNIQDQAKIREVVETWLYKDIYTKVQQKNSKC